MTEHQWELYRLSVVETWPDSPYKTATIAGIQHKLAAHWSMRKLKPEIIKDKMQLEGESRLKLQPADYSRSTIGSISSNSSLCLDVLRHLNRGNV